jgi:hypothetical protein
MGYVNGTNLYAAFALDPVSQTDPFGLCAKRPIISAIRVAYVPDSGTNDAQGVSFWVKVSVVGQNLDCGEIRQLIKSSTTWKNWDGTNMTPAEIANETGGDPNATNTDGKFVVDSNWDWQALPAEGNEATIKDGQLINVTNRQVAVGKRSYVEVRLATVSRSFRIQIRETGTDNIVKVFDWGYEWSNANAAWTDNTKPPSLPGEHVALYGSADGEFRNVYGLMGVPWGQAPASRPTTAPATHTAR